MTHHRQKLRLSATFAGEFLKEASGIAAIPDGTRFDKRFTSRH
jgi:hypothetical protein